MTFNTVGTPRAPVGRQSTDTARAGGRNDNLSTAERLATQSTTADLLARSDSDGNPSNSSQQGFDPGGHDPSEWSPQANGLIQPVFRTISDVNPQINNPNLIQPGQILNMPGGGSGSNPALTGVRSATPTSAVELNAASVPPGELSISDAGLEFITGHEGLRLELYNDPAGHATIGVGHLVHLGPIDGRASEAPFADGITEAQAMDLLREDVSTAEDAVRRLVDVPLNQNQFDALVSFTFNLGEGNLASSTLLRRLNEGDYAAVPGELNRWVNADGQQLPGLVRRRAEEGELFTTPVGDTSGPGPVRPPAGDPPPVADPPPVDVPNVVLRNGSRGSEVENLQQLLLDAGFNPGTPDGIFGSQTESAVQDFQSANNLTSDGIVGPDTWRALSAETDTDSSSIQVSSQILRNGARGPDVTTLQEVLRDAGFDPGTPDGVFGAQTESAVRDFQRANNLRGVCYNGSGRVVSRYLG